MTAGLSFIDVAPDPVSAGGVILVVLLVLGLVVMLAAALVIFLWYRKRSLSHLEMGRPDDQQPSSSDAGSLN